MPMKNNEFLSLLNLLDDPSQEVYNAVENRVIEYGKKAIPDLEYFWERSANGIVQGRIESIIQKIHYLFLEDELDKWMRTDPQDLLYGAFLVSLIQYPGIEFADITTRFEEIKRDLWLEMNEQLTALEKIRIINHVLFQVHKFKPIKSSINVPQHFFINNLLETRHGNQYSMAMLYASLAQSVGLPVYGVRIPNNYLLAYYDKELAKFAQNEMADVLFYIDPYNAGAVFGTAELSKMLKVNHIKEKKEYFQPAPNNYFIMQIYNALKLNFKNSGHNDKALQVEKILRKIENKADGIV